MNEWVLMELDGLLTKETHGKQFTFNTVLPEDVEKGTPAAKIGLGWFVQSGPTLMRAGYVPHQSLDSMQFGNTVISEITELYAQVIQTDPENWREAILLRKGYTTVPSDRLLSSTRNFQSIPAELLNSLQRNHSLPEIAFIIAAGLENEAANWLKVLKDIKSILPDFQYEDAIRYITLGVESEDLYTNMQLPFEMVKELYD